MNTNFRLMSKNQQEVLIENTTRNMNGVTKEVKLRHIRNCFKADKAYGEGLAKAMNIPTSEI